MHDDGVAQLLGCGNRPVAVRLDDLHPRLRLHLLDLVRDEMADIAGARNHDALRFLLLVTEEA
ncbi:hypothetical protein D3C86_1397460 [compost metagenome]